MPPRTIVIETSGGVINDVHGLPPGWIYEIADWDDADDSNPKGITTEDLEEMIEKANNQNK